VARVLDPALDAAFDTLGATPEEKGALIAFFEGRMASANARVQGYINSIADLTRQQAEAQVEADRIGSMLEKFTDEAPAEEPAEEPSNG